jgi:hypothetical protein
MKSIKRETGATTGARQPKNHSIRGVLLAADEISNTPSRKTKNSSPRSGKPSRSTLKRDSEVSRKLAALPRPLKPPGRT